MSETPKEEREDRGLDGPSGPQGRELVDAVLGWNLRFLRTAAESLLNPVAVARAALRSETDRYVSPLRVFVFLYGLLLAASTSLLNDQMLSLDTLAGGAPEDYELWLAGTELSFEAVNDTVKFWMNLAIWPITILSTLPYVLVLKLFRPRRTFYGHLLVYLVANNGPASLQIIFMLILATVLNIGATAVLSSVALLLAYLAVTLRLLLVLYAETLWGGLLKFLVILMLTPITLMISGMLAVLVGDWVLQLGHGLSLFSLLDIVAGATP